MPGNGSLRRAMQAATIVTELTLWIVGGLGLGSWLDGRFGTGPWLFLTGTLVGFGVGLLRLFLGITRLQNDDDDSQDDPP